MNASRNLLFVSFVSIFITLYFAFIITFYVIPKQYDIPILLFIGFALFIIGFFYFFMYHKKFENGNNILTIKSINENTFNIILITLIIFLYFIPPITFSEMVIDWSQISPFNYLRGIVFIVGCSFVPGSSIFQLIFPSNKLHEYFKIEPFFVKLIIYPLLSFTFLGSTTLIFDQLGLLRSYFSPILLILILLLFFINILNNKRRGKELSLFKKRDLKISKSTLFILYM